MSNIISFGSHADRDVLVSDVLKSAYLNSDMWGFLGLNEPDDLVVKKGVGVPSIELVNKLCNNYERGGWYLGKAKFSLPANKHNNQPFKFKNGYIMHDGTIHDFKQLAKKYEIKLKGESDSEIISHFLSRGILNPYTMDNWYELVGFGRVLMYVYGRGFLLYGKYELTNPGILQSSPSDEDIIGIFCVANDKKNLNGHKIINNNALLN